MGVTILPRIARTTAVRRPVPPAGHVASIATVRAVTVLLLLAVSATLVPAGALAASAVGQAAAAAAANVPAAITGNAMLRGDTGLIPWLAILPIVLPLLGAAITLTLRSAPRAQATVALAAIGSGTVATAALAIAVAQGGTVVTVAGNWLPPFGIVIAVDALGALFLLVTSLVGLVALGYARADVSEEDARQGFYVFYCLLIAGVSGSFATGDLFNLYVWFEVFLVASFGLLILGGREIQLDAAVKYGLLNLVATTIFLIAVAALYGVTGTLNMADIRTALARDDAGPIVTIRALFVVAFGMKAAAFPLHAWLPASYHAPGPVAAALFAGLLTKVGIYALLRVMVMLFAARGVAFEPLLGWLGAITAVVAAVAAIAQVDPKRMAAFFLVSGIGVILIGIGLGNDAGRTGAIVYTVHSMVAMTGLFLALGASEHIAGALDLRRGTDLYARAPAVAGLFLLFALSAAGLPPLSGFWPKLMLAEASLAVGGTAGVAFAVAVIVSGLLMTVAAGRAWSLIYLRPRPDVPIGQQDGPMPEFRLDGARLVPLLMFGALVLALGLFPAMVLGPADRAAADLAGPGSYLTRSLSGG